MSLKVDTKGCHKLIAKMLPLMKILLDTIHRNLKIQFVSQYSYSIGFPDGSGGKESDSKAGDPGLIPGRGKIPSRRERLPTPIILAWEIPWTMEPGRL